VASLREYLQLSQHSDYSHADVFVYVAVPTDMLEDRVDPDFSFAGRARSMSPGELTDLTEQCTWGMDADSALVKALHRGIGVHHSGLPTKYRQVVEILFRCHYLRVVIATGDDFLLPWQNTPCTTPNIAVVI